MLEIKRGKTLVDQSVWLDVGKYLQFCGTIAGATGLSTWNRFGMRMDRGALVQYMARGNWFKIHGSLNEPGQRTTITYSEAAHEVRRVLANDNSDLLTTWFDINDTAGLRNM